MYFSASQLSKSSARQILYLRDKPKAPPTANMLAGDQFAREHTKSQYVEMGGIYRRKDIEIAFCVDEVAIKRGRMHAIEHKSVREDEIWYFRSSLIQTAFYACLIERVSELKTARWYDGPRQHLPLKGYVGDGARHKPLSFLNYGGIHYRVYGEAEPIMRFFLTKARATMAGWVTAGCFDAQYKGAEWDYFKKFIKYRKV